MTLHTAITDVQRAKAMIAAGCDWEVGCEDYDVSGYYALNLTSPGERWCAEVALNHASLSILTADDEWLDFDLDREELIQCIGEKRVCQMEEDEAERAEQGR